MKQLKRFYDTLKSEPIWALVVNVLVLALVYMACRLFFFAVNHSYFEDVTIEHLVDLCLGGIQFDRTAIVYMNVVLLLAMILPLRSRNKAGYQKVVRIIFVVFNGLAMLMNCSDTIYFRFTNRRTSWSVFDEFGNESNIAGIFLHAMVEYWYVVLFFLLSVFVLWKVFYKVKETPSPYCSMVYYPLQTVLALAVIGLAVAGARGGFTRDVRPITLSNANQYINKTAEAAIVLNTPFSMLRTIKRKAYKDPKYFNEEQRLVAAFNPEVQSKPEGVFLPKNVVVIILESFGKEYSGLFNPELEEGKYKGFTPFLDSLYQQGVAFKRSYATGRKSIDAMPSILSSIPMYEAPFVLTPYGNNSVNSLASLLGKKGYYSAFFHGAPNGSMGFQSFAKLAGFTDYFGMTEYNNDADFDNYWAIWDEEFLQFFAQKMGEFKEPFVTSLFSASSHDPFNIPERYKGKFDEGSLPIHKCIGYTDNALRKFFDHAKQMPWYKNTLFVITADHTNQPAYAEYTNDEKRYSVPILFYMPGDTTFKGMREELISQVDIMPSVLGLLHYDFPFVAFGKSLFGGSSHADSTDDRNFVINYNDPLYQMIEGDYMLQWDGLQVRSLYQLSCDPLLSNNLVGQHKDIEERMANVLKANIQQYMVRMVENRLVIAEENK